jgi:hypothetical protein
VVRAAPIPFPRRRTADLQAALFSNPRLQATLSFNRALLLHTMGRGARGTIYWSNHAFFFTDEAGSSFRMDSWLRPVDRLMRTAWGAPLDQTTLPATMDLGRLRFPVERAGIAVMSYADAWHPSWKARVNGRDTPVYAGNLAYKAIPIQGGKNLIEFRFGSRWFSALSAVAALNAALWLAAVAVLMWRAR